MPVPKQVTKEFFIPDEFSFLDSEEDEHTIDELPLPPSRNDQNEIDNLFYLFDLLDESLSRTNHNNETNDEENDENDTFEDKDFNDELLDNEVEENIDSSLVDSYHQAIRDLDELEDLLTEFYILTSGRGVHSNEDLLQELQVNDDD